MHNSMMHFMGSDMQKREEFLRLFQSSQPALFTKVLKGEQIGADELSDEVVRGINQIIYARDPAKDVDIQVPQPQITREVQEFIDAYVDKLPPARLQQLYGFIRADVASMKEMTDEEVAAIPPSRLPMSVQFMVEKWMLQHLPDEIKGEIKKREKEQQGMRQETEEELARAYQAYINGGWMFDGNLEPVEPEEESEEESEED